MPPRVLHKVLPIPPPIVGLLLLGMQRDGAQQREHAVPADLGAALAALQASNERSGALTRRSGASSLTPRATPRFTPRQPPSGSANPHSDLKVKGRA